MTETESSTTADVTYADLSAFQRDVLVVLRRLESSEEDSYGLAIKRRLEDRYDDDVNHGRLYPNLDELVEFGLVERGEIDKRTNRYTLTAAGLSLLQAHADALDELLR
ncbi:PadR family transcriptional regulator [Halorientalis pallida]|uniref:PadR family transcriptional regulator n=1 Tax=Halorientalis pallida TaxID=2479928 RepID=A0A498KVS6_9EURY|nr:helix-turn-helix transcriptional regulator [Halorientalis pallida]RXK49358.1 PadR family transcriptional regulator [Halorientalis pallida]